jgi:Fe-S oxidoreductase/nitrate reductase gamma subunit
MPTREVFGNISGLEQVLFFLLMALCIGGAVAVVARRARGWRRGQAVAINWRAEWRPRLRRLFGEALGQRRVRRRRVSAPGAGRLHLMFFSGFVVLTIGTTLLAIHHLGPIRFHRGLYYLLYEATMDLFGVLMAAGLLLALVRRFAGRPRSLSHDATDVAMLALLLAIAVTGFTVEAFRLQWAAVPAGWARWSPVGDALAALLAPAAPHARAVHRALWWLHVCLIGGFFLLLPRTRLRHLVMAPLNILLRPLRHPGALAPVAMAEVEETGRVGLSGIEDFTWQELLSLDSCIECGRCDEVCPALATGKPLSPKSLILDAQRWAQNGKSALHGETIGAETLWACTMCQACVRECPSLIGHVDLVAGMRRHLVAQGEVAGPPGVALRRIGNSGNPWGMPAADRMAWAEGLEIPTAAERPDAAVLYWVGCAAAFDQRAQKVARAFAALMRQAGVDFAILGREERCTGDPARRIGDEFLFQELAQTNIETLNRRGVRRIVTACPHCFNTLRNEYPQFGGQYEVQHHSAFLQELIAQGRLPSEQPPGVMESPGVSPPADLRRPSGADGPPAPKGQWTSAGGETPEVAPNPGLPPLITLHDPCYLGRVNGVTEAPRAVLGAAGGSMAEMGRSRDRSFCCGAGGGRMWMEEAPSQRVNRARAAEAIATGAGVVATACPFCLTMMTDGVAAEGAENVAVRDIAEVLLETVSYRHP